MCVRGLLWGFSIVPMECSLLVGGQASGCAIRDDLVYGGRFSLNPAGGGLLAHVVLY